MPDQTRETAQVLGAPGTYLHMDSKVVISNETLRRLIRQTDSRTIPARPRHADAERIARRLRGMQTGRLRARITQG